MYRPWDKPSIDSRLLWRLFWNCLSAGACENVPKIIYLFLSGKCKVQWIANRYIWGIILLTKEWLTTHHCGFKWPENLNTSRNNNLHSHYPPFQCPTSFIAAIFDPAHGISSLMQGTQQGNASSPTKFFCRAHWPPQRRPKQLQRPIVTMSSHSPVFPLLFQVAVVFRQFSGCLGYNAYWAGYFFGSVT